MNTRQAKKLLCRQWHKCPPYWFDRVIDYLDGRHLDHRITKAISITRKKK